MRISKSKLLPVVLAVALITALAIWQPWRGRGTRQLRLTVEEISPVVILPFETSRAGEDWQWLSIGLVDLFATRLNSLPHLRAVRLERMLETFAPLSVRTELKISSQEALHKFAGRTILAGQVSSLNSGFQLDIRLLDCNEEKMLARFHRHIHMPEHLFAAIDSISADLALALYGEKPSGPISISLLSTGSLAAYQHYIMAVEDYILSDESSLPRAADHLTLAVAADSSFARAYFLRAKVSDQAQALSVPLELPEKSLVTALVFPDRLPEWERLYALGWKLWLVDGHLDEAVAIFKNLTTAHWDYAWQEGVPLTLGRLLVHQGQWPEAIKQLEVYVQSEEAPALRRILGWGQLANAYQTTGNLDGAARALEKELSLAPDPEGNRHWWIGENTSLALLYFERGDEELMEGLMQDIEEAVSDDPQGLAMIGLARFRMQQVNRAETLVERALRRASDLASAHYLRGLLSLRRKNNWQAVADLEASCTEEFEWDYLYHAAIAHEKQGDLQSAQELWTLLMEFLGGEDSTGVAPSDMGTLGILLSRLDRDEEALRIGLEALERFPYPQAKYQLACIYAIQGDRAAAMQWLRSSFAGGFVNRRQARADFDLENLWYDPDFILLTS